MTQLKILIYDTNFVKGVPRVILIIKIKYWQKMGCKITIFCTKEGEEFYRTVLKNIDYITIDYYYKIRGPLSIPWEYTKVEYLALKNIIKIIGKFDVIYSQSSIIDFLFFPWILKFFDKKIKWFIMVDNIVPTPGKRPGPYLQKLIPYLAFLLGDIFLKRADGIFILTDPLKKHHGKLKMKNVTKTNDGYGIEIELFKGAIPDKTPRVNALFCGRLHIAKGIFDLVEVANIVTKSKPDFTMGILGNGDQYTKDQFLKKIKEYNLEKKFLHFGFIIDKRKGDIYRNCDFYISLSYDESFGHSILEALACNKIVIAYDLPVYHDVFSKYIKNGQLFLFKKQDYKAIANFILNLDIKNLHFNNNLNDYTWDNIVKNELESMIKSIG